MRSFDKFYHALLEYKEQYGDMNVPHKYCVDGYRLGFAVNNVRSGKYVLYDYEINALNQIGFLWWIRPNFDLVYQMLLDYIDKYGNCNIKVNYVTEDGVPLGTIVNHLRMQSRKITTEQKKKLDEIGFVWNVAVSFENVYKALVEYKKEHGDCNVPYSYVTKDGIKLGTIMSSIKNSKRKVTKEQKKMLANIGFVF